MREPYDTMDKHLQKAEKEENNIIVRLLVTGFTLGVSVTSLVISGICLFLLK